MTTLVKTSYKPQDVAVLLQDVEGRIPVLYTQEREKLNQQGVHYSEMLPVEYKPSKAYLDIYYQSLKDSTYDIARYLRYLGDQIIAYYDKHPDNYRRIKLVSLARAGTPFGILLKRYIEHQTSYEVLHYTISIIRGKGIDTNALNYIFRNAGNYNDNVVFVDGWTGKGTIARELKRSLVNFSRCTLPYRLAVLADPANVATFAGTLDDIFIPSSALNATVSGLMSRTAYDETKMGRNEFHGAVYYEDLEDEDLSYHFIDTIWNEIVLQTLPSDIKTVMTTYNITDVNKVKPGIGEATRVLLRRVPDKIIIDTKSYNKEPDTFKHILQLASEKQVEIVYQDLKDYKAIGIIKDVADL